MAKRKRVGALNPKSPVVMLAATAAGYLLGDQINTAIDKVVPASMQTGTMSYIPVAAELGLGAYLLMGKGKSSILKTAAGGILAGAGIKRALKKFGVIAGYQAVPVIGGRRMSGYQAVPVIGGGVPDNGLNQLSGYRVNGYMPNGSGSGIMGGFRTPAGADPDNALISESRDR